MFKQFQIANFFALLFFVIKQTLHLIVLNLRHAICVCVGGVFVYTCYCDQVKPVVLGQSLLFKTQDCLFIISLWDCSIGYHLISFICLLLDDIQALSFLGSSSCFYLFFFPLLIHWRIFILFTFFFSFLSLFAKSGFLQ